MSARRWLASGVVAAAVALIGASTASAQYISNARYVAGPGHLPNDFDDGVVSFTRILHGQPPFGSQPSLQATMRVVASFSADSDLGVGPDGGPSSVAFDADYTFEFDVTAPGAYVVHVTSRFRGAMTLVGDSVGSSAADVSALTGTLTSGGTLASGGFDLPDPGALAGTLGGDLPFESETTARIEGVSNGVPIRHEIHFTWSARCDSILGSGSVGAAIFGGDECAVRLGQSSIGDFETAGNYPGVGNRVMLQDGHRVTVAVESDCGNGVIDGPEECDDGANNGDAVTCCSELCELYPVSPFPCREIFRPGPGLPYHQCDLPEYCDGVNGACPADAYSPAGTLCRAEAGCNAAAVCDGASTACPASQPLPDGDGDGTCDAADNCPAATNGSQADGDGDDLGDVCDPCTNAANLETVRTKLTLARIAAPPGDDTLKYRGELTIPATPPIDLAATGARVLLHGAGGAPIVDATLPGGAYDAALGAGWKVNGAGTAWTYRNKGRAVPLVAGIKKLVARGNPATPGRYKFSVSGARGDYPVVPAEVPVEAELVLEGAIGATNRCGVSRFPGPPPSPACVLDPGGTRLRCR